MDFTFSLFFFFNILLLLLKLQIKRKMGFFLFRIGGFAGLLILAFALTARLLLCTKDPVLSTARLLPQAHSCCCVSQKPRARILHRWAGRGSALEGEAGWGERVGAG